jgi:hypothetical protein
MILTEASYFVISKAQFAGTVLANSGMYQIIKDTSRGVLVDTFRENIFPYMIEIGTIVVVIAIVKTGYAQVRNPNLQKTLEDLKNYTISYGLIKGAFTILGIIDKIITGIKV